MWEIALTSISLIAPPTMRSDATVMEKYISSNLTGAPVELFSQGLFTQCGEPDQGQSAAPMLVYLQGRGVRYLCQFMCHDLVASDGDLHEMIINHY